MTEEQILKGRLADLAKRAYNQNIYTYSNFLSAAELSILDEMHNDISYIHYETFGGNELSERQIVAFGSEEEFGYPGTFPISVIRVSPLLEKFSDNLNHRDFLGALMHLGIERDMLGDILIKENTAYIFCLERIVDYICQELTKVKHTNVKCEVTDANIPALTPTLRDEEFPVASLRLDGIIASLLKCSRKEALSFFENRQVLLNGRITGRNSILLKEGDIFSIRGHGKFIFEGTGGNTKKGKIYVHIKRYV
ncbi:MAG: YlmH/Sll1252 family protein [Clostridiales bacterium]|nr:YlmH/Sll1252 family protein [Clostridiales bacterium]